MSNLVGRPPIDALPGPVLASRRSQPTEGLSRRTLMRRAVGAGLAVWLVELVGGTGAFLWSAAAAASPKVRVGTFDDHLAANQGLPIRDGFPAYVAAARAFIVIVDPSRGGWVPGSDPSGEGSALNVRALSQRCPHLGCRPNPCVEDFWFRCPCHQSRYDRLGIKPAGEAFGPAPHGMDRYAIEVDATGVLTVETGRITLGPLPVALVAPGLIPPRVANGCR